MFKFLTDRKTQSFFDTIRKGDVAAVRASLQGSDLANRKDKEGRTALMIAAESNQTAILELILSAKPDLNLKDETERTALMLAAGAGHIEACRRLIEAGANTALVDQNGRNAFAFANAKGQSTMVKDLLSSMDPRCKTLLADGPEDPAERRAFEWMKQNESISVTASYKTSKESFLADSAAWVIAPPELQVLTTDQGYQYVLEYRIGIWEFSPGNFKIPTGTVTEFEADAKKMTLTAYYREAAGLKCIQSKEQSNLWKSYTFSKAG